MVLMPRVTRIEIHTRATDLAEIREEHNPKIRPDWRQNWMHDDKIVFLAIIQKFLANWPLVVSKFRCDLYVDR